jgi:hypothetical protein
MSDAPEERKRRGLRRTSAGVEQPPSEAAVLADAPPPEPSPAIEVPPPEREPEPPVRRRGSGGVLIAVAAVLVIVAVVATTPFWAPAVVPLLPWGSAPPATKAPAAQPPPAAAPDTAIAVARAEAQAAQNAAAMQQLGQRVAALETKPPLDLSTIQQQLAALTQSAAALSASVGALQKAAQSQPATDPKNTALALVLLQIRDAVDVARPFDAEYQTLLVLARDHPEIVAAAQPLAAAAANGVASRSSLAERLRELAPRIATARPPPNPGWKSQIVARLRALVTIRRIEGEAQSPAEAAVSSAERDMAGGDLAAAVAALSALTGPAQAAAAPWLQMAAQRLAVETALRQVEAAVTAALGNPGTSKG